MLTIRIPRALETRLDKLARQRRQNKNELANRLLEQKIREQAEYERWFRREVAAGLREADTGKLVSHEEAMRRLDRWKAAFARKSAKKR
jgi:predicted transcriptional regulator